MRIAKRMKLNPNNSAGTDTNGQKGLKRVQKVKMLLKVETAIPDDCNQLAIYNDLELNFLRLPWHALHET